MQLDLPNSDLNGIDFLLCSRWKMNTINFTLHIQKTTPRRAISAMGWADDLNNVIYAIVFG